MSLHFDLWIGKTIVACLIEPDHETMFWLVDGVWYTIDAVAEMDGRSWFEHCDDGAVLAGSVLQAFNGFEGRYNEMDSPLDRDRLIDQQFLKFETSKGRCTIELRTDHWPYYGGGFEISLSPRDTMTNAVILGTF